MNVADQYPVQYQGSPQTSLTVRVYPQFANSLYTPFENGAEATSPAPAGGLLFGSAEKGIVTLRAFRAFAIWYQDPGNSPEDEHVDRAERKLSGSFSAEVDMRDSELVGWCYLRQAGSIGLLHRDIQFHSRHFPRTTDLILILNAGQEQGISVELFAPTANLPLSLEEFRWGSFHLGPNPLSQPIEVTLEERRKRDWLSISQIAGAVASGVTANTAALLPEAPSARTNGLLWPLSAALFVLVIAMTFGWAHTRAQYLALTGDSRAVGRLAQISNLRMQAENSGDGILLRWNRDAAAVRSAKQGILHIQDGPEERTIYLDPSDITNSSIVYRPDSKDASFRLEILGERGSTESNSVRVHDSLEKATPTQSSEALLGYVPARALKQVLPDKKRFASWNAREGTRVDVQVRIDENGRVQEAHVNDAAQNSLLRNAALKAAKQWLFEPAKRDGKNIPSDHTIEFQFNP